MIVTVIQVGLEEDAKGQILILFVMEFQLKIFTMFVPDMENVLEMILVSVSRVIMVKNAVKNNILVVVNSQMILKFVMDMEGVFLMKDVNVDQD